MFKTSKRNITTAFSQNIAIFLSGETDTSTTTAKRSATTGDDDADNGKRRCERQESVFTPAPSTSYQASTLTDQPQLPSTPPVNQATRCCTNCGVYTSSSSDGDICSRCLTLPFCTGCKRRLQPTCFDQPSPLCHGCARRKDKAPRAVSYTHLTLPTKRIV